MAELTAVVDRGGPAVNSYAVGNLRPALPPSQVARFSPPMCPAQTADQFLTSFRLRMIDILVDRLMADGQARVIYTDPAGNLLRRPAHGKLGLAIGEERGLFQPRPTTRALATGGRTALRPRRKREPIFGRGLPLQLAGDRAGTAPQRLGNLSHRLVVSQQEGDHVSFG